MQLNWTRGLALGVCLTLTCLGVSGQIQAKELDVVGQFQQHIDSLQSIDAQVRDEAKQLVSALAAEPQGRNLAITEGLLVLYPEFANAMELAGSEQPTSAVDTLVELKSKNDPYLSAAANFLHARTLIMEERFEDALPVLEELMTSQADYSSQIADATYFKGMCQANILRTPQAIETLTNFLELYPASPERMRVGAWRKLQQLHALEDGSIADVHQRMHFSRRQLQLEKTGERTQEEQEKIVKMLNELIKKVEDSECQGAENTNPGEKQSEAQGQKPGDKPGQSQTGGGSRNPNGVVKRSFDDGPASEWSRLRDRGRDPAFSAIKEKYPARYQKLIEQYYKSFQNGTDEDDK